MSLEPLCDRDRIAIQHLVMSGLARHEGHAEAIVRQLNENVPLIVYVLQEETSDQTGKSETVGVYSNKSDPDKHAKKLRGRSFVRTFPLNGAPKRGGY